MRIYKNIFLFLVLFSLMITGPGCGKKEELLEDIKRFLEKIEG